MNLTIILGFLFGLMINKTTAKALITEQNEVEASKYLENLNEQLTLYYKDLAEVKFAYYTNITTENGRIFMDQLKKQEAYGIPNNDINIFNWRSYSNPDTRRQFKLLTNMYQQDETDDEGNDDEWTEYMTALYMLDIYYKQVTVCDYKNKTKCGKYGAEVFEQNNDPKELMHYWREIHQKTGEEVRETFEEFIRLSNVMAHLKNFPSKVEMLLDNYEDNTLEQQLDAIVIAIRPLFEQIHAFLRYRMQRIYGENIVSSRGPIPIHLLDYLLRQDTHHSAHPFLPYPRKAATNITEELIKQAYTPLKMFELGDDFFTSMNMSKLPESFWNNSILEKPKGDRRMDCGPFTMDMYKKDGVQLIQCAVVNQEHFIEIHRQLAKLQYMLQYQNQPFLYRSSAVMDISEAFQEAVVSSVLTPRHLERVGLLPNYVPNEEERMNRLFLKALKTIFHIPFLISQEKFIWALIRDEFEKEKWNCAFWKFRDHYSGIEPPVKRNNTDFDIPALYGNSSYTSILSKIGPLIVQFQLYKSACIKASQYDPNNPDLPLDKCDFYGSSEAGKSFSDMLSLGKSRPWPDVLEALNGERRMNASSMIEYFKPLELWLRAENAKNGVFVGWTESNKCSY